MTASLFNQTGIRLYVLGAGFSRPAGLPLGSELFDEVWRLACLRHYDEGTLGTSLKSYKRFLRMEGKQGRGRNKINIEDFISYLDVEHLLHLQGPNHWSNEGNKSQLIIRNLIALSLYLASSRAPSSVLSLYDNFVRQLSPQDFVVTFNYDTLLEDAFERCGIAYRLVPYRFEEIDEYGGTLVWNDNEVLVLKLHGSMDWFDKTNYLRLSAKSPIARSRNPVFGTDNSHILARLCAEPYDQFSKLYPLYRLRNIGQYLCRDDFSQESPLIISPSHHKIGYLTKLEELWSMLTALGYYLNGLSIIGFSMPPHDGHVKQVLFEIIDKFQNFTGERGRLKRTALKMVDYRVTRKQLEQFRKSYHIVDWSKTECYLKGFDNQAINMIFN